MASMNDILRGVQMSRMISDPITSIIREGRAAKRRREDIEEARKYQKELLAENRAYQEGREQRAEDRAISREERQMRNELLLKGYTSPESGIVPISPEEAKASKDLGEGTIYRPGATNYTEPELEGITTEEELRTRRSPFGEGAGVPSGTELGRKLKGQNLIDQLLSKVDRTSSDISPAEIPPGQDEIEADKETIRKAIEIPKAKGASVNVLGQTGFGVSPEVAQDARMKKLIEQQEIADITDKRDLKKLEQQEEIKGKARSKYGSTSGGVTGNKRLDTIRDFVDLSGMPAEKVLEEIESGNTTLDEMGAVIGQFKGSREIPSTEIKAFISWESLDRNFANLEKDIQGLEGEFGPINGNINEFLLKYPIAKQDPRVAEVFAKINSLSASQIHEKYGGALTPGEMARAQRWAVSTNVPLSTLKARIKEARSGIADEKGAFQKTLKARHLRAPELFEDDSPKESQPSRGASKLEESESAVTIREQLKAGIITRDQARKMLEAIKSK